MPVQTVGDLDISFTVAGPDSGRAVLLLHGWPDDASTWAPVARRLAAVGFRTIAPSLRGFADTRFRSDAAPRTGDSGMLAIDAIGLLDALGIGRFIAIGHDWGSNAVEALAVGWPERVERLCMLATPPRLGGMPTPPFAQAQRYWYHWFMATGRGAQAVRDDRRGFARIHWENWAPAGWFDEETFARVAAAWNNPDWVEVTLHSYRSRWGEAAPDPRSAWLDQAVKSTATLALPTLFIKGEADGVTTPDSFAKVPAKFSGPFEMVALPGVGHFPQREAAEQVAALLVAFCEGRRP